MALSRIPFDINQVRDWIKSIISRLKLNIPQNNSEASFTMSLALSAAAKKTFYEKAEIKFSAEPVISKHPIVHFKGSMRIDALEKFNNPTVFSYVHFYKNFKAMQQGADPLGVVIIYVEKVYLPELLRLLHYPYVDSEDDSSVKDGCGALVNLIAGHFKKELINLGYQDMEMSHFKSYINLNLDGVEFPPEQLNQHTISFDIDGQERMIAELVMSDIPRA